MAPAETSNQHKCCMGVSYFNRAMEQRHQAPKCFGFQRLKEGDIDYSDVRQMPPRTLDFQYYCVGYSVHPDGSRSVKDEQQDGMPYCEGIEIAVMEEHQGAALPSTSQQDLPVDRDIEDDVVVGPSSSSRPQIHNSTAAASSSTSDEAEEDRTLQTRFAAHLQRNLGKLRAALVDGQGPVAIKPVENINEVPNRLLQVAQRNVDKMQRAANMVGGLLYARTLDTLKPFMDRFSREQGER